VATSSARSWPAGFAAVLGLLLTGCTSAAVPAVSGAPASATATQPATSSSAMSTGAAPTLPRPAHVVVVVLENHDVESIIGSDQAPYLNQLAASGASFTQSYAVTHPSEPNYLALFSGSTHGVRDDSCPLTFSAPNLATALTAAGYTFTGYSEGLPGAGYTGCSAGGYARKHNPWADFTDVPASANQPFTSFPHDYAALPTVAFVIPDLEHDMHDGTIAQADNWLRTNLGGYAAWAAPHGSLLVVTFDEDDFGQQNHIATIVLGAHVRAGRYAERIDHYRLLRTITALYGATPPGAAADTTPITSIWLS
jgi:phosphatidylinositol-3-phosphatase